MNKKLILSITVLSSLSSLHAFFDFNALDDHFEKMEKQMRKMRKGMKKTVRSMQLPEQSSAVSLKEEDDAVVLTFTDITTAEATLQGDQLSVVTPEQRITITVRGNVIGIETAQEQKETRQKGEDDDSFTAQYIGSSYSSMSQAFGSKLLLDQRTIDLDEENHELIVRIPKKAAKKSTPVTINKISRGNAAAEEANEQAETGNK